MATLGIAPFVPGDALSLPGRNENWAGPTADGRQVFVKRLDATLPGARDRFERARAFERARSARRGRPTPAAPEFLGADPDTLVLVHTRLDAAVACSTLADEDRFDTVLAGRLGHAVGTLHRLPDDGVPRPSAAVRGHSRLTGLTVREYADASGAELEAWALLHHDARLRTALGRLHEWSAAAPRTPVHGDLRLDQFLLGGDGDPTAQPHLTDWEEFHLGDPAGDVGGFVGQWLYRAASRMFTALDLDGPGAGDDAHTALVGNGERQLVAVRPLVTAFWEAYRRAAPPVDAGFAARATAYAGWHLFDRMFAAASLGARLTAVQKGTAGVGRTALLAPERFAETVGLSAGTVGQCAGTVGLEES